MNYVLRSSGSFLVFVSHHGNGRTPEGVIT
jgi:hypothetical protein